uniref:Dienelactone hydrolase domain-containing protein n=1 Tax=Tetradesmus obliquus TaxID=3088 RepID=A0A383VKQ0_TETOB|eukprot:jgi/Sobl393_1/8149/SZX66118.1
MIAGVPCYTSKPSSFNGCAIILATDIFGYKLVNSRLIADVYADNGFLTVMPDYFRGEPMNIALLETYEALPSMSLLGKLNGYAQLAGQIVGMGSWLKRHPVEYAIDVVTAAAAELRDKHGARKVGLQGYCYGGKVGVKMAAKPELVNAVCSAHPGLIKIPEDIQAVQVPLQFICAASDAQFPEKTRTAAQQLLQQQSPGLGRFILYPGTQHGFAVRGSKADPAVDAARQDALQQGIGFFKQHLAGVQPPAVQAQADAAAAVGVVL